MSDDPTGKGAPRARGLSWLVGAAAVGAVIVVAVRASEGPELLRLVERAEPWWLLLAAVLQAATYLAEGQVMRVVARAGGARLSLGHAARLAVAKLFVDQALPSAGISGLAVVGGALEQSAVPRRVVMAWVAVDSASYYAAYLLSLWSAVVAAALLEAVSPIVVVAAVLFSVAAVAIPSTALAVAGAPDASGSRALRLVARVPLLDKVLAKAVGLLHDADAALARSPSLIARATVFQLAIVVLDVATLWALLASLGVDAPPIGVFASFMVSTLFRTISVIPGGLGTFEAASVWTLKLAGVAVPVALSATLLFRGLSFWVPMLPGLWFARGVRHGGEGRTSV